MRKRGISHVYSTEPLNKNAVLTINVREYILFNQIAMKPLTEGNVLDREFIFTFSWIQLTGLGRNKPPSFTSLKHRNMVFLCFSINESDKFRYTKNCYKLSGKQNFATKLTIKQTLLYEIPPLHKRCV